MGLSIGLSRSTSYRLVREYRLTGRGEVPVHAGAHRVKWDVWMENLLVAAIGRFPESTLTMLKFRLDAACAARNLPTVSVSTIGRRLDKKLITWKVSLSLRARWVLWNMVV